MKRRQTLYSALLGTVLFLTFSCVNPKSSELNNTAVETVNKDKDSLEQARTQRIDSASLIQSEPSIQSSSVISPKKTVKKKVINDGK